MTKDNLSRGRIPTPGPAEVDRAIKLSYVQMMLNAIFGASTGGMFLIGFAIKLGADNALLGLMGSIPQFFVVFQFLAAFFIERGVSRKKLAVLFGFLTPFWWFLIAAIPFFGPVLNKNMQFGVLIGVITLVTMSAQFVGNARSSWIGELIPMERRGRFFGYCTMFAGVVGAGFAIVEGRFLDYVGSQGLLAFTALFLFGALFGLAAASLNIPQPDCPLPGGGKTPPFLSLMRDTFRNRRFVLLAMVHAVIALGGIAGPFTAAYCLRDVGMSFFGFGLLGSVSTAAVLLASPQWGKLVDRIGCRPILILGLLIMAPCAGVWLFIPPKHLHSAYMLLPWTNFIAGVGGAAISVAISTMMYKTSKPEGRSVQFAAYSVFVTLFGAPMPVLGAWLVSYLEKSGYAVDLRITFYIWSAFMFLAAFLARSLDEPDSIRTRALVFSYFPNRVGRFWGTMTSVSPFFGSLIRFQMPGQRNGDSKDSKIEK